MGSTHPAHLSSELEGIPPTEKFAAIDVSDSDDPGLGDKIAALQTRNYQEHPEVAAVVAQAVRSQCRTARDQSHKRRRSSRFSINRPLR